MTTFLRSLLAGLLAVALTGPVAAAEERAAFSDEELDQMLAPIALYPDSLLSQVLMASTYPLEVVQAARWSRANPNFKGDEAVKAVESMDWDPSVKSLVAFPQILQRMDERLDWTQRLGEAFLAQEPHVLDTIQGLRKRAAVAGNLNSNEHLRVTKQEEAIVIEPARPEAVYVPYYNPAVVYGPWWYPAYPPVYWAPFPGYYASPAFAPAYFWGPAIVVSTGFFFGHCNWHHHNVTVVHGHPHVAHTRYGKPYAVGTPGHNKPVAWQHDPMHRKGVPYRQASLRDQFGNGRGWNGSDGRGGYRGPASAPGVRHGDSGRDSGPDRGGQAGAPNRPSPQGSNNAPNNGYGKPNSNWGSRPGATAPTPGNDRRADAGRDNDRFQGRDRLAQNQPTRQGPRPDSNGNGNVLRFPRAPGEPSGPVTRGPNTNGNDAHRFQGHVPAPRPAPAPSVRQDYRPPVGVPQRTGQYVGQGRPVMPQHSAPAPQARGAHPAPRMAAGGGQFRGSGSYR